MAEKLKQETIEDLVQAAHRQVAYLIETMLRQTVADFEGSQSEDFKLVLTIEGERKVGGGELTLQSNGASSVNLKRKDQTPAIVIDYGPTLFDANGEPATKEEGKGKKGRKLLKGETKLLKAAEAGEAVDGEVVEGDGE